MIFWKVTYEARRENREKAGLWHGVARLAWPVWDPDNPSLLLLLSQPVSQAQQIWPSRLGTQLGRFPDGV